MVNLPKVGMSASEFLQLPETMLPTELIEGEVIRSPAPTPEHQFISGEVYARLRELVPNGKVAYAPLDVYLDEETVLQPDVLWIAEGSSCVVEPKFIRGAPDLVVEVHSEGTVRYDKGKKFAQYEKFGVREYWMIDPDEKFVEVWYRDGEKFARLGVFGDDEPFTSPLLGKLVDVASLFR